MKREAEENYKYESRVKITAIGVPSEKKKKILLPVYHDTVFYFGSP